MLLRVVRSCCAKFETGQTFSYVQTDATTLIIIVGHQCCTCTLRNTCIALCNLTQHCWPTISQHCWMLQVASVCTSYCMLLRVVAQCLIPVKRLATCKRTQQLPTWLGQQCWELLRPFARTLCLTFISQSWLSVSRLNTSNILPVWLMRWQRYSVDQQKGFKTVVGSQIQVQLLTKLP